MKRKMLFSIVGAFLVYILVFGVLIFSFKKEVSEQYRATHPVERFYSDEIGPDRAVLIDDPQDSAIVRVNMIETAQKTIDISYYSMESGKVTNTFWGLLLEAANRGVKVRIILDGIANGMKGDKREIMYAVKKHPNIQLKLYERINIWKPWTLHNRLHDKYIIVDGQIAVIGGRNISDRFMVPNGYKGDVTFDRDVVIYSNGRKDSVIQDLSSYFNEVYNSQYAKDTVNQLTKKQEKIAIEKIDELQKSLQKDRELEEYIFGKSIDWGQLSFPTNKITLIHNPIQRFMKEPWVWYEINQLFQSANESIFLQSPYIIPSKQMMDGFFDDIQNKGVELNVLTNSRASTPNYLAFSVYLNYRKKIVETGARVYEYHGEHSIHTKAYGTDDDMSLIGSFNLDPRSSFLSTETMVVIHSKDVKNQLDDLTNDYVQKSLRIGDNDKYMIDDNSIDERNVNIYKEMMLKIIGFFGRFFEFLL